MDVSNRAWLITGLLLAALAALSWWAARPEPAEVLVLEGHTETTIDGRTWRVPHLVGWRSRFIALDHGFDVEFERDDRKRALQVRTTDVQRYPDVVATEDLPNGGTLRLVTNRTGREGVLDGTLRMAGQRYRVACTDVGEPPNPTWCVGLLASTTVQ